MRDYFAAWGDREAYAVSHVGWGMNARARWDALALYDKRDVNGTEQRAFAGNFLYSTGANEVAGRHTLGHFDLPFRHCTIELDGKAVVKDGKLARMTTPMAALVFLHGVGGGHHAWEDQVPYFGGLGYPSHAWDQPGYGKSALVEPYDLEQVSAALARLIESLGGEPVVLVGHSMGGFVAQETYARYPQLVKALALCFTSPAFAGGTSEFTKQFLAARIGPLDEGRTMAEIAAKLMPTMGSTTRRQARRADHGGVSRPTPTARPCSCSRPSIAAKALADIKVPTLLVAGSEDKIAPAVGDGEDGSEDPGRRVRADCRTAATSAPWTGPMPSTPSCSAS